MRRYSPRSAERHLIALIAFAVAAVAPVEARRGPTAGASPAVDRAMTRKQQVEMLKEKLEPAMREIRACAAGAPPGAARVGLEAELGPLEGLLKDAAWTYHVGNYDEALKRHQAIERRMRPSQLACDRIKQAAERCTRTVTGALERIRGWSVKIARVQDPASRARCEGAYAQAEKELVSLEKSCATTDPAWVGKQIPVVLKPLDDAIRTAR